ncbi:MAG: hypothetical protein ACKOXM_07680 [Agromyces sp.]
MQSPSSRARQRARVIVAASSVLGVGAVVTLAAWTANTYLEGEVKTGTVTSVEYSFDGSAWATSSNSASPTKFVLSPTDFKLTPGDPAYIPFALRTSQTTDVALPLSISSVLKSATGTDTGVTYKLFTTSTFGCTSTSTVVKSVAPALTSLTSGPFTNVTLAAGSASAPGTETNFCLVISATTSAANGVTPIADWSFAGGW